MNRAKLHPSVSNCGVPSDSTSKLTIKASGRRFRAPHSYSRNATSSLTVASVTRSRSTSTIHQARHRINGVPGDGMRGRFYRSIARSLAHRVVADSQQREPSPGTTQPFSTCFMLAGSAMMEAFPAHAGGNCITRLRQIDQPVRGLRVEDSVCASRKAAPSSTSIRCLFSGSSRERVKGPAPLTACLPPCHARVRTTLAPSAAARSYKAMRAENGEIRRGGDKSRT